MPCIANLRSNITRLLCGVSSCLTKPNTGTLNKDHPKPLLKVDLPILAVANTATLAVADLTVEIFHSRHEVDEKTSLGSCESADGQIVISPVRDRPVCNSIPESTGCRPDHPNVKQQRTSKFKQITPACSRLCI
jgi:hypothetical protein